MDTPNPDTPTPASRRQIDRLMPPTIPRPTSAPALFKSLLSPDQAVANTTPALDDDIPCKFEIGDKVISGKLKRSFETTINALAEEDHLEKRQTTRICTSIIISGPPMSTLASVPPIHMPKTEPNTEVKIEPESWHVLRHWVKVKIQTTGELMIVQVSYLPEEGAHHSAWTEDPASPPPLQASRSSRPSPRAPIIPAPVYLNASPQMVVNSPEPFAYDDQDLDDHGLETNATPSLIPDQDEESIINDVFICVGCTHHFDMSSCLDVDQPEHISPSSRREGEESGWFCYGCLAEAYRDLRDEMDALRAILEDEQKAAREEAVEAGNLRDEAPAEEIQVEEGVLVDLDPAFDEDMQQQEDVRTPTGSENTLIASDSDLAEELQSWVTLQDTFSIELEQIASWMPETGMESPNKDVKPVEEQLSMFRLQLTILMSANDLSSWQFVKIYKRLASLFEQHTELLIDRPRLWLDILPLCPAPQEGMMYHATVFSERVHGLVETLLTTINARHETELAQRTRARIQDTLTVLARSKTSLRRLREAVPRSTLSSIDRIYGRKLSLAMKTIVDAVRWIWEEAEDVSKAQLEKDGVEMGIARTLQSAMDIIWIIEDMKQSKKDEKLELRDFSTELELKLNSLLWIIDSLLPERSAQPSVMRNISASPTIRQPGTPLHHRSTTLLHPRPVSSTARLQSALITSQVAAKMNRIDAGDYRLIRPASATGASPIFGYASPNFGRCRTSTPVDGIPTTLLWRKTPVECISPRTMELALRRSRSAVPERSCLLRETVRVARTPN